MRIVLHIGSPKTGTTTLQRALKLNENWLMENGFRYLTPSTTPTYNQLVVAIIRSDNVRIKRILGETGERLRESDLPAVISSELFFTTRPLMLAKLFGRFFLQQHDELEIVVYLRRQDIYFESLYTQRSRKLGYRHSVDEYLDICLKRGSLDYHNILENWKSAFPNAKIIPRIYDRSKLHKKDCVADFLNVIGIDKIPPETIDEQNQTLKMNGDLLTLLMAYRSSGKDDIRGVVERLEAADSAPETKAIKGVLTNSKRRKILGHFKEGNKKLCQEFFPDHDELFSTKFQNTDSAKITTFTKSQIETLEYFFQHMPTDLA